MSTWSSKYDLGDTILIGDLRAHVGGIWFDDAISPPMIQLMWIYNGDVKTAWVRENNLFFLIGVADGN